METARDIAERLIYRAKNLSEWIVTKRIPFGFIFLGASPFDMYIDERGIAEIRVWAVTAQEADEKVDKWINANTKDHE
jgi:hypothetical protein